MMNGKAMRRPGNAGIRSRAVGKSSVADLLAGEQALTYEERIKKALNLKPYFDYLDDLFTDRLSDSSDIDDEPQVWSPEVQISSKDNCKSVGITQAIHTLDLNLGATTTTSQFGQEKSESNPEAFFTGNPYSSLGLGLSPDPIHNASCQNGPEASDMPTISDLELHKYLEKPTAGLDSSTDDYLMSFLGSTNSLLRRKRKWGSHGSSPLCDLKSKSSLDCTGDISELNISKTFESIPGDLITDDTILPHSSGVGALKIKDDPDYGDFRDCMKTSVTHDKLNLNQTAREDNDEDVNGTTDRKRIDSLDDEDDDSLSDYMNVAATSTLALDTYFKFDTEDLTTAAESPISPVAQIMPALSIHRPLNSSEIAEPSTIQEAGPSLPGDIFGGTSSKGVAAAQNQQKVVHILNMKRKRVYIHLCRKYIPKASRKRSLLHEKVQAQTSRLARICARYVQEVSVENTDSVREGLNDSRKDQQRRTSREEHQLSICDTSNDITGIQQEKLNVLTLEMSLYSAYIADKLNGVSREDDLAIRIDEYLGTVGDDEWSTRKETIMGSIKTAIALTSSRIVDRPTPERSSEPTSVFCGVLKTFQQTGVHWLNKNYDYGMNGILADESGLGKTVQALALLGHLLQERRIWGPFLIVTQACELQNWYEKCIKFLPDLIPTIYSESSQERKPLCEHWQHLTSHQGTQQAPWHIFLTTPSIVAADKIQLNEIKWEYLIIDCTHDSCTKMKPLLKLNYRNGLFLGGNLTHCKFTEVWQLLQFVMPMLFESDENFEKWAVKNLESEIKWIPSEKDVLYLTEILERFVLRRSKRDVVNELSEKVNIIVKCPITLRQRVLASEIKERIRSEYSRRPVSILHLTQTEMTDLMGAVMQLRKVYNHPDLVAKCDVKSPFHMDAIEHFYPWIMFSTDPLHYNRRQLHFLQNHLNIYNPVHTFASLFRRCTAASMSSDFSSTRVERSEWAFMRLLGIGPKELHDLVVGGFASRWTDVLDWVKKVDLLHKQRLWHSEADKKRFRLTDFLVYPDTVTSFPNVKNSQILANLVLTSPTSPAHSVPDNRIYLKEDNAPLEKQWLPAFLPRFLSQFSPRVTSGGQCSIVRRIPRKFQWDRTSIDSWTMTDKGVGNTSCFYGDTDLLDMGSCRPENGWSGLIFPSPSVDSGKLRALESILAPLSSTGQKVVIYTQMNRMMKLLEEFVVSRNLNYLRLDLDLARLRERLENSISNFCIILAWTRSGDRGTNLSFVDTVIFYDTDWNVTFSRQALDRICCLDRTKKLTVYHLTCNNTIEMKILEWLNNKVEDFTWFDDDTGSESMKPLQLVSILLQDEELCIKSSEVEQKEIPYCSDSRGLASKRKSAVGMQSKLLKDRLVKKLKIVEVEPCPSLGSSASVTGSSPATSEACTGEEDMEIMEGVEYGSSEDNDETVRLETDVTIPEDLDCVDGGSGSSNRSTPTALDWNAGSISDYDEDLGFVKKLSVSRGMGRRGRPPSRPRVRTISREDGTRRGRPLGRPRLIRIGPMNQAVRGRKPGRPPTKRLDPT